MASLQRGKGTRREEAVSLLREVSDKCASLGPHGIMLMPSNADDMLAKGYQLHIKANLDEESISCINPLVEQRGLKIKQEKDLLVIYRPIHP
jgi:hypothetical protein